MTEEVVEVQGLSIYETTTNKIAILFKIVLKIDSKEFKKKARANFEHKNFIHLAYGELVDLSKQGKITNQNIALTLELLI